MCGGGCGLTTNQDADSRGIYSSVARSPTAVVRPTTRKFSLPVSVMPGQTEATVRSAAQGEPAGLRPKDRYRVVVMGRPKVGKTAIINQFLYDRFVTDYKATVEEMHKGEYDVAGSPLTLDILDTSGSNEFPAMRALSISSADAFVLVYAVDDAPSFDEIRILRELILETKSPSVPLVVVGNKSDLTEDKREVSQETAETIVTIDWENGFVEASAKTNSNIVNIFKELLAQAHIPYALSPAVRKRRQSLPNNSPIRSKEHGGRAVKRNSCAMS